MCKKKITLNKHTYTKHGRNIEEKVCYSQCLLCEEKFDTKKDLQKHKQYYIKEIKGMNISEITIKHDLFECNSIGQHKRTYDCTCQLYQTESN